MTADNNRHITLKVIVGYISIFLIAIGAVVYIYNKIKEVTKEESPDNKSRTKVYLITNTQTLLYESEALVHTIRPEKNDFNKPLDMALRNMDSLRTLISDSAQLLKIDTINLLIERKRLNTSRLLQTLEEANAEYLYIKNIAKAIAGQDTGIGRIEIEQKNEIRQDTLMIAGKTRGFFRRLADVFSPSQPDSDMVVKSGRNIKIDTIVNTIEPSDNIVSVLKGIQGNVSTQREEVSNLLLVRVRNLQYSNNVITGKINQLLHAIEDEEMSASFEHLEKNRNLLHDTTNLLMLIAVLSVIIIASFLILIAKDISRSKYYRMQLEESKQYTENLMHLREKLMLAISHDIRAPLSSIIGYIELLSRLNPNERQQYYLDNMTKSSGHILDLVNNLLDAHRLESGKMEIRPVPFNLQTLTEEIYAGFKPMAEAKGLQLIMETKGETDSLYETDPILLRRITGNLLSNAIKFTANGSATLRVLIREKNNKEKLLAVIVSDTGPGIPKSEQEKIFSEFTRLSQTKQTEGFGLGLSITYKLVKLLNGNISIQSTPGKGSEFRITLPVTKSKAQDISDSGTAPSKTGTISFEKSGIRCLLIDDDPIQSAFTEELLKQLGIRATICLIPQNVPGLLKENTFDLVLTDIQMPETDGFQLLKIIRNSDLPGTDKIHVIAVSAGVDKDEAFYRKAGFSGFLSKPFTLNQLTTLLNQVFPSDPEPGNLPDFSILTAFADGDEESSRSILSTFFEETAKNIKTLEQALQEKDRQTVSRTAHKMIPVFTLLEKRELVSFLLILEKDENSLSENDRETMIVEIIKQLKAIVAYHH